MSGLNFRGGVGQPGQPRARPTHASWAQQLVLYIVSLRLRVYFVCERDSFVWSLRTRLNYSRNIVACICILLSDHTWAGVYTPDSWIYQLGTPLYVPTQSFTRPPRVEVKHFNGDPRNWPMFIQSFKSQVHDACHSDSERLSLLRNCLTTDVQKQIGEAMLNHGLWHFALRRRS